MEEKSREIGEAAEGYHGSRPWPIIAFVGVTAVTVGVQVGAYTLAMRPDASAAPVVLQALAVGLYLLCVGLAFLFALSFSAWWRCRYREVITEVEVANPRRRFLADCIAVFCWQGGGMMFILPRHCAPQFQPLAAAGGVTIIASGMTLRARILQGRWPWRRGLFTYAMIAVYSIYAMGVLSGVPPVGGTAPGLEGVLLRLTPLLALGVLWIPLSAVYSLLQFRRLQRLVNEEPDGTR